MRSFIAYSLSIIGSMNYRRARWAGIVASMVKMTKEYKYLTANHDGKRAHGI
jgi:hypothetical protein